MTSLLQNISEVLEVQVRHSPIQTTKQTQITSPVVFIFSCNLEKSFQFWIRQNYSFRDNSTRKHQIKILLKSSNKMCPVMTFVHSKFFSRKCFIFHLFISMILCFLSVKSRLCRPTFLESVDYFNMVATIFFQLFVRLLLPAIVSLWSYFLMR